MLLSFMLCLFIYVLCYLCRTIALVATVICWPYPTLNKFYLILSYPPSWWRHQVETFSTLLAICVGNSAVTGEFPSHRPVTRWFDVFFHLRLNKRLCKQSRRWWFETPSRPLWRHCNWNETLCHTPSQNPQIQTANIFSPYKFNLVFRNGERNVTYGRTLNR